MDDRMENKMINYFMVTKRMGFSNWSKNDIDLAKLLWGEEDVTKFICASGKFTEEEIENRLETEIRNGREYGVQYWPIFELASGELIGCCGVRPFPDERQCYEIGFHLRSKYWGMGYAFEGAEAVIDYSRHSLKAEKLYAGHHPQNEASKKVLEKLGFWYIGNNYYEPTGLYHPSYEMKLREDV